MGHPKGRVVGTPPLRHIPQQSLLAIVGSQHGDLVCWVADQAHVLIQGDHILCLCKVLEEIGHWSALPLPLEVWCICRQHDVPVGCISAGKTFMCTSVVMPAHLAVRLCLSLKEVRLLPSKCGVSADVREADGCVRAK